MSHNSPRQLPTVFSGWGFSSCLLETLAGAAGCGAWRFRGRAGSWGCQIVGSLWALLSSSVKGGDEPLLGAWIKWVSPQHSPPHSAGAWERRAGLGITPGQLPKGIQGGGRKERFTFLSPLDCFCSLFLVHSFGKHLRLEPDCCPGPVLGTGPNGGRDSPGPCPEAHEPGGSGGTVRHSSPPRSGAAALPALGLTTVLGLAFGYFP